MSRSAWPNFAAGNDRDDSGKWEDYNCEDDRGHEDDLDNFLGLDSPLEIGPFTQPNANSGSVNSGSGSEGKNEGLLLDAAKEGDYESVRRLTSNPINLETRDDLGMTPLTLAAWKGHQDVVELLLRRGSNAKAKTTGGSTIIHWAAATSFNIVELLLAHGADINAQEDFNGETALSSIAVRGDNWASVVDFLMKCGADPEIENKYGMTPARWAAARNHFEILCALLNNGAKIGNQVKSGSPALHLAASGGHERIVKRLLEIKGVDINSVDKNGYTPLSWAAKHGRTTVVKILLDKRANIHASTPDEKTPVDLANENGHPETVSILRSWSVIRSREPVELPIGDCSTEDDKEKQIQDAQQLKIMALAMEKEDKKREAEILLRQAVGTYERALGLENTTTLTAMDLYSKFLRNRESYKEAEEIHRKMWKGSEKLLGSEHESTITCMYNLATVLGYQGKYGEAEQLHRQTLSRMEKEFGPSNDKTQASIKALAVILMKINKVEEAANLLQRGYTLKGGRVGLDNPDVSKDIHNVVQQLRDQGRYEQAEAMLRDVLAQREKRPASRNLFTHDVGKDLVRVLLDQKKYKEAEKVQEEILFKTQDKTGVLGPDAKEGQSVLWAIRALEGNHKEAERTLGASLDLKGDVFKDETPASRKTMISLLAKLILAEADWDKVDGNATNLY
jgi:ankyrin repeat protein/tetratricopeptide (TPR) repeat protein